MTLLSRLARFIQPETVRAREDWRRAQDKLRDARSIDRDRKRERAAIDELQAIGREG